MNVLAQSKAVLRRPMRGLEDGMSVIQQSEAAAPRLKIVVVPSCATTMLRTDGEPCQAFAVGPSPYSNTHAVAAAD